MIINSIHFRKIVAAVAVGILVATSACGTRKKKEPTGNTSTSGTAVMVCDASFENIMQQEIDVFEFIYPNASVLPYYIDEAAALDSIVFGNARLAVTTRPLTKEEREVLRAKKRIAKTQRIAVDAVAVIVNPDNPVEILSTKELGEILTGQVTEWNDLEPSPLGKIEVVFDHQGSSIVKYMRDSLMAGADFGPNVFSAKTNAAVFEAVSSRRNAIGLIGVSWVSSDLRTADMSTEERVANLEVNDTTATDFVPDVKVLRIRRPDRLDAYKPYQAYIFDGSYPLFRSIWLTNTGAAGTLSSGFFSFVTSFRGQKLIQTTGVLPATVHPRMVSVD